MYQADGNDGNGNGNGSAAGGVGGVGVVEVVEVVDEEDDFMLDDEAMLMAMDQFEDTGHEPTDQASGPRLDAETLQLPNASGPHLDLSRAPYALYGVKYIDAETLQLPNASGPRLDLSRAPYVLYGVEYLDVVSPAPFSPTRPPMRT